MSAQLSLEDAWLKLQWAQQIYNALRGELETLERSDSHRISFEVDSDSGEYVFFVHDLPPLDPTWGLRIGDCLHNARCALDYLMVRLVALGMGKNPAEVQDVQFPIYQEPSQFNGAIGGLKKERVLAGWLARVEELQPFNVGNPSIWGWSEDGFGEEHMPRLPLGLDRLTILDNLDKHRCVLQPWHGPKLWGGSLNSPSEFRRLSGGVPMDPLTEGAVIARVQYAVPLPGPWEPDQADMKRNLPIQVSFSEPSPDKSVIRILAWCLWAVETTLRIFEPVFVSRRPPLLVTISLPIAQEKA